MTPARPNDATPRPRWVRLPAEAKLRGFSTEGLRRWCRARGVPVRQSSHRDAWVSPAALDEAVEGLPIASGAAAPDDIEAELNAHHHTRR